MAKTSTQLLARCVQQITGVAFTDALATVEEQIAVDPKVARNLAIVDRRPSARLPEPVFTFAEDVDIADFLAPISEIHERGGGYLVVLTAAGTDIQITIESVTDAGVSGRVMDPDTDEIIGDDARSWTWDEIDRIHLY